ncbi:PREDICTED: leucine-rich repeat and calponin homology domain-containing protein 3-like isoform X2 [Poecilia mexicana]|uniref:leucine-rich repeat and calponin homology domain-containing protein 3-like isoform X2 n=1 Tax=Poecilia mexicana TaxID=48701 RepID=UPI00072E348D|nr:PREDICTED: leucine-rich repeat and calponin homology domain-containing protein 3-like isoform X2 [Poecilia mexicana]XP_016517093.1 PREDICTED: leucine-rich repeat and calponin homology domain-containing protein 3 isoform X2 [Poecilia formosa]
MAASVLLGSAESTGLNFTVGAGGNAILGNSNGLGQTGPASWNRSLDRALEEASVSGCLNLSGRKLKEFPRSAANHDLTDTVRADLSRNRLSELPLEVCLFVSLEYLNLYQNCLRSLPDGLVNLQALTHLNLSRNQLSVLPAVVCSLPLKVLIASNNKLVSLPEELGQLRHLTELDVSCNEIRTLPSQVGQLEALRDLNIRRNHLVRLPSELAELPLVRLDFSCNKVTSIPVCYRGLTQLQAIVLDNNPLQSPPAQICIKGKVHIFKFLNLEASKTTPELPEFDRRPLTSCVDEAYPGRLYGALDSGFNSVDSGDKRWLGNEVSEEPSELPVRDQRRAGPGGHVLPNGTYGELEQIDFIDSCVEEEEEGKRRSGGADRSSLSSQFMAYIERRITREGSPVKNSLARAEDMKRHSRNMADGVSASSSSQSQRAGSGSGSGGVERMRREAQLAALRYDEERQKNRSLQRDSVTSYSKHKAAQSPSKSSPEPENVYPSRRSTHTDDSALIMQGEDRATLSPTANQSPSYPGSGSGASSRTSSLRPESFLYRLSQRDEKRKGDAVAAPPQPKEEAPAAPPLVGEDAALVEQLRKNIEARLKVALPSDLGAALTDGVVLCHLANHVRPRSVPSIHVPSPAVPKLTMAKCRRNVENFLEACRRIGVPQDRLCSVGDVLEGKGGGVYGTLQVLLSMAPPTLSPSLQVQMAGFALFYLSVMSALCAIYVHLAPHA